MAVLNQIMQMQPRQMLSPGVSNPDAANPLNFATVPPAQAQQVGGAGRGGYMGELMDWRGARPDHVPGMDHGDWRDSIEAWRAARPSFGGLHGGGGVPGGGGGGVQGLPTPVPGSGVPASGSNMGGIMQQIMKAFSGGAGGGLDIGRLMSMAAAG